jgi:diguanylate cyclase (GGDEF)-like protein
MNFHHNGEGRRPAHLLAYLLGVLVCLTASIAAQEVLYENFGLILFLCVLSASASRLVSRIHRDRIIRLAPTFVLVGMITINPSAGLWIGLSALIASPDGLTGSARNRPLASVAGVLALAFTSIAAGYLHAGASTTGMAAVAMQASILYLILSSTAITFHWFLERLRDGRFLFREETFPARSLVLEMINILLAWILASYVVTGGALAPFVLFSVLILLGSWVIRKLASTRAELQDTNDALAARVTELATLHAIGREIVSSLDPRRVYTIIERESRKILDVSVFSIALTAEDGRGLVNVYSHDAGRAGEEGGPIHVMEKWVLAEKRGLRILNGNDDLEKYDLVQSHAEEAFPSALVVPLIVEERVIGVLKVQSERKSAYDQHQLALLTTIAQQAAVAIENARNYRMATIDSLTGVFLRDYFFQRVEEEYVRAKRYRISFALIMIDLDGFKQINDDHGHMVGDLYLKKLGEEILSSLRAADMACRYGGDEFCLLLPETDLEGARIIAERLRTTISELTLEIDGAYLRTTASIGVALFPDHAATNLTGLLKHADQALYRAKRQGKNRVIPFSSKKKEQKPRFG